MFQHVIGVRVGFTEVFQLLSLQTHAKDLTVRDSTMGKALGEDDGEIIDTGKNLRISG